jgi:hypothetical protein
LHIYFLRSSNTVLQVEVGHGKKAVIIFVPVPLLQGFHKIQQRYEMTARKPASQQINCRN